MDHRSFYLQLFALSTGVALVLLLLNRLPALAPFSALSWIGLGFFLFLSILMYYLGYQTARSSDKQAFTSVILIFSFTKIALSVLVLLLYSRLAQPASGLFVLPFLGTYVIYTVFETYFMMRLGRMGS